MRKGLLSGNFCHWKRKNVYRRMGFVEEGRQRNPIKYEDGSYDDYILMVDYLN